MKEGRRVLDLLGALATEGALPAGRALRELLVSFDEPLRRWEAEQAAEPAGRERLGWAVGRVSNTF